MLCTYFAESPVEHAEFFGHLSGKYVMKILIVSNTTIPVQAYGGQERIVWWLGQELHKRGHEITFLVKKDSDCNFGKVLTLNEKKPIAAQIPDEVDLVHLHLPPGEEPIRKPYLITCHDNATKPAVFDRNTVFLSRNHALQHGASVYVYNGLNLDEYGVPLLDNRRMYFHFLGKAAWTVKNVRGAIDITRMAGERLHVIGGHRINFRMGMNMLSPHVRFHGMLGGDGKKALIQASKGLIFPTVWHEPFGLAIIESLYFGCPVFGTPYGALPELLGSRAVGQRPGNGLIEAFHSDFGFLSIKKSEIAEALKDADQYNRRRCQEYVADHFSAGRMADDYLKLYDIVLNGGVLHAVAPELKEAPDAKLLPLE